MSKATISTQRDNASTLIITHKGLKGSARMDMQANILAALCVYWDERTEAMPTAIYFYPTDRQEEELAEWVGFVKNVSRTRGRSCKEMRLILTNRSIPTFQLVLDNLYRRMEQ